MYKLFTDFGDFEKEVEELGLKVDLKELTSFDYNFIQIYDKFTLINLRDYSKEQNKIILLSPKGAFIYGDIPITESQLKNFNSTLKKKQGESTVVTFLVLDFILLNYKAEFENIRRRIIQLEQSLEINKIEEEGNILRKLIDRLEDFGDIIIKIEERKIEEFNSNLIKYDYSILTTESKYWLDRCRSNMYRIASLRTKCDIKSNSELNSKITKLTVIITFLTIVTIVISIPGTIGAIFGIPALSNAYFEGHSNSLIFILITSILISILLGYIYWKNLNLKT